MPRDFSYEVSGMFDSKVAEERNRAPWFCRADVVKWMKAHAGESLEGDNVIFTVRHRPSVATRFWFGLEFTDNAGTRRTVTASDTDLLTWRADIAANWKHPYLESDRLPKPRVWRIVLFGFRITIER